MKKLFQTMLSTLEQGQDVVLCTILASSGSTPRGEGARMLVFADGTTLGTIGGGAVELHAARQALEVFTTRQSYLKGFCLAPNQVADIGMICGGTVTVYYQLFDHTHREELALVGRVCRLLGTNQDAWLVSEIRDNVLVQTGVYDRERGVQFLKGVTASQLKPLLKTRAVYHPGEPAYYAEPISRKGFVYLFGGGHVGQALLPVLDKVGFRVVVYDSRPNVARPEHFPQAVRVIHGQYHEIGRHMTLTEEDYVVIMTPGHQGDYEVLEQALRTPAGYVGCIGSAGKVAATKARLIAAGIDPAQVERMHSPIGLPIGGETPEEIAISVAAELILHRSQRT